MDIPVIETERLILRGHAIEDFPSYAAMWKEPVVTRFIGGAPLSEEEAWAKFLRMTGHWALMGYGFWAIVEKSSGARIGEAGILNVKRDMQPSFHGVPEIGWGLLPSMHGKGYATEAVNAALDWGRGFFGHGARTVCVISTDNAASLRVAEKAGFKQFATATRYGLGRLVFERML